MKMIIQRENGTKRVMTINNDRDMADQSFKEETDVNEIVRKYLKTGQVTHLSSKIGRYMDVSEIPDLQTALTTVQNANAAFAELPATMRKEFDNDPVQLLEFLKNPANKAKAIELGLIDKPAAAPAEAAPPKEGAPKA